MNIESQSEAGTSYAFSYQGEVPDKDFELCYSTEEISKPKVVLEAAPEHPDEVAAQITFIPRAQESAEEDSDEEEDMGPGEFIFVIDRSGSMGFGSNRIDLAKQALTLFIQSIPTGSKFDIVSFGSRYNQMFNGSVEYT